MPCRLLLCFLLLSSLPEAGAQTPAESDAQAHPLAGDLWVEPSSGLRFRYIPAGSFRMGSNPDEPWGAADETPHQVELTRSFWIGETEITQEQWRRLGGGTPSYFTHCGSNCPVEMVSWFEAATIANRLSESAGFEPCYEIKRCTGEVGDGCPEVRDGRPVDDTSKCRGSYRCKKVRFRGLDCAGFRLPTEAEWEYAARAGTSTAVYSGPLEILGRNNSPDLDAIAWYGGNSGVGYAGGVECGGWQQRQLPAETCGPHPVAGKRPNAWGLYDMLGNVLEWVEDQVDWNWRKLLVIGNAYRDGVRDPIDRTSSGRLLRGGSWYNFALACRAAERVVAAPEMRLRAAGVRLARTAGSSAMTRDGSP